MSRADVKQVGGFIALLQTLTYAVCGMLEMWTMGDSRKGALKDYALLCTLTQGGMLFTNWCAAAHARLWLLEHVAAASDAQVCGVACVTGRWST